MKGIAINNISKSYDKVRALDNVQLHLEENKIYGLLGRNGAGKTSLLNIINGRLFADSGQVLVDGEPALENDVVLRKLFMTSEKTLYPESMRIKVVYEWTRTFYPDFDMAYAQKASDLFELDTRKKVKSLSTGFVSIFKLVAALSANTPYLFFDEPVLGLDANNRDLFYKLLLEKYCANPCTIVISTHLIEEVSSVIEEVIVIKSGTILVNEPRESLLSRGYAVSGMAGAVDAWTKGKNIMAADTLGGLKTAYILDENKANVPSDLTLGKLDLQKLFIHLTNS